MLYNPFNYIKIKPQLKNIRTLESQQASSDELRIVFVPGQLYEKTSVENQTSLRRVLGTRTMIIALTLPSSSGVFRLSV